MGLYDRDYMQDDYLKGGYGYATPPVESARNTNRSTYYESTGRGNCRRRQRGFGFVGLLNFLVVVAGIVAISYVAYSAVPDSRLPDVLHSSKHTGVWKLDVERSLKQRQKFYRQFLAPLGESSEFDNVFVQQWLAYLLVGVAEVKFEYLRDCWQVELELRENNEFSFRETNLMFSDMEFRGRWAFSENSLESITLECDGNMLFGRIHGDSLTLIARENDIEIPVCTLRRPLGWIW